jgi:hypothetical protein
MLIQRSFYFVLCAVVFGTASTMTGCTRTNDGPNRSGPPPFQVLPEDNNGTRSRSITYVYDRRAADPSYPPKIDSSIILFAYNAAGKIDSMRFIHNEDFLIYDFRFIRNASNKITSIHGKTWYTDTLVGESDLTFEYNASGNVSLLKLTYQDDPLNEVDSMIVKTTGSRIDSVIDRTVAIPTTTGADKYAYKYNGSGDIIQIDHIRATGIYFSYLDIYKYTLSNNPAALVLGEDAIYWYFLAMHNNISGTTRHMLPEILFHSAKQPSKLAWQCLGEPVVTSNYSVEHYGTGLPKKMTATIVTGTGELYAREAYYYTYAQ